MKAVKGRGGDAAQVVWLRSALNEKETELLETREQHQRLLVQPPGYQCSGRCGCAKRLSGSHKPSRCSMHTWVCTCGSGSTACTARPPRGHTIA